MRICTSATSGSPGNDPGDCRARLPGAGLSFLATDHNLVDAGYVEEEFFVSGYANMYETPAGKTGQIIDGNYPYKTRIVIRRPTSPVKFNGVVILEWNKVTAGHDNEADWFLSGATTCAQVTLMQWFQPSASA